jgi:hypothetical protein
MRICQPARAVFSNQRFDNRRTSKMLQSSRLSARLRPFTTTANPPSTAPKSKGNGPLVAILSAAGLGAAGIYYYTTLSSAAIPSLSKDEFIPFKLSAVQDLVFLFELTHADAKH